MTENFIQLKKDNIIRVGIKDQFGNDTGKTLDFDMDDVELPLRYQQLLEEHNKNFKNLRHKFMMIDKRQDVKGKKLLSKNEEDKVKALNEYFKLDMKALDLFLGEGKTQMILDIMGRKPYWNMFEDIGEAISPILEKVFQENMDTTDEKIVEKYKEMIKDQEDILK